MTQQPSSKSFPSFGRRCVSWKETYTVKGLRTYLLLIFTRILFIIDGYCSDYRYFVILHKIIEELTQYDSYMTHYILIWNPNHRFIKRIIVFIFEFLSYIIKLQSDIIQFYTIDIHMVGKVLQCEIRRVWFIAPWHDWDVHKTCTNIECFTTTLNGYIIYMGVTWRDLETLCNKYPGGLYLTDVCTQNICYLVD